MEADLRALVLSDIHSNDAALRAVLSRVRRKKFDRVICLGDFVGYGAQPNQVIDAMRMIRAPKVFIRGNHDRVAAGLENGGAFNYVAKQAVLWTRDHLTKVNRHFLRDLPQGPVVLNDVIVCHGTPHDEDEYLFDVQTAANVFHRFDGRFILHGHTHMPMLFWEQSGVVGGIIIRGETTMRLDPRRRYLINPGSVGQPRDRNASAAFAIFDSDEMTLQILRAPYDIARAQAAILRAGLPVILAHRLSTGT